MARPLKIFMRGKRVAILQEILQRMGYPMQDQKGLFGVHTRDAVKAIQKQRSLKVNGEVDDPLFLQIQQGYSPLQASASADKTVLSNPDSMNQAQLDALISILLRKGMLEAGELEAEMTRAHPTSLI